MKTGRMAHMRLLNGSLNQKAGAAFFSTKPREEARETAAALPGAFRDKKRAGKTLSHQPPPSAGSHRPRVSCNLQRGVSREPAGAQGTTTPGMLRGRQN
ncbi:uncharacterized protein LOC141585128 [Saimiri boliviensis]|uniref:uncharacterized protein LOC141585128 n=1 Tax=Saimiri boliviensis TaxID=27679 RepID=UPI003D782669